MDMVGLHGPVWILKSARPVDVIKGIDGFASARTAGGT